MRLLQIFAAMTISISMVGCVSPHNAVCDSCDPCGQYMGGGCGCYNGGVGVSGLCPDFSGLKSILGGGCLGRRARCGKCIRGGRFGGCNNCCEPSFNCGGCDSCGMSSSCGAPSCGAPMSSDCGCGMPGGFPSGMQSSPVMSSPSSPSIAPSPPAVGPSDAPTSMIPSGTTMPTQNVSYEEFQRLPGTIISGPGAVAPSTNVATSAPVAQPATMAQRPVQRAASSMPVASVSNQGKQPVWVPAP